MADPRSTEQPWRGDVSDGVAAWTRAATPSTRPAPDHPGDPGDGAAPGPDDPGRDDLGPDDLDSGDLDSGDLDSGDLDSGDLDSGDLESGDLGPEPDHESVARKILLDQLTGAARSRKELADKLARKNVPEDLAQRLLDRFEEVGLIDDEAFARAWIASRRSVGSGGGKGLARRALAQELRRKGIDDLVAREALEEIDPDDEEAAARALVRRKLRSMSRLEPAVATRRLVGMLGRKGYPPGLAFAVVRDELGASADALSEGGDGPALDD